MSETKNELKVTKKCLRQLLETIHRLKTQIKDEFDFTRFAFLFIIICYFQIEVYFNM